MLLLVLLASGAMAGGRYLIIGINKDASGHDKLLLLGVINKYLDPAYTGDMAVTIYKVSNPSIEALVGSWDIGGRHFPFTKQQALNYFVTHAGDFDDVTDIKLLVDDNALEAIRNAGFEIKSEEQP